MKCSSLHDKSSFHFEKCQARLSKNCTCHWVDLHEFMIVSPACKGYLGQHCGLLNNVKQHSCRIFSTALVAPDSAIWPIPICNWSLPIGLKMPTVARKSKDWSFLTRTAVRWLQEQASNSIGRRTFCCLGWSSAAQAAMRHDGHNDGTTFGIEEAQSFDGHCWISRTTTPGCWEDCVAKTRVANAVMSHSCS